MHYVTQRSDRMQKHKFGVTYPGELFLETALGPPEHEKLCVDVSHPGCTIIYYVAHRSHQMQKHKFGVTCLGGLFCGIHTSPTRA
jgi:hypothetical protein